MASGLEDLKEAIVKVEEKIEKVEREIDSIQPTLVQAAQKAEEAAQSNNDMMFKYWSKREEQLRDEKNKLLDRLAELEKQRRQQAQAISPPPPGESQVSNTCFHWLMLTTQNSIALVAVASAHLPVHVSLA